MRINTSDKFIAYLALLSGLSISAVAIYYSVAGLVAIFAAAVIPIVVMGVVLETGKLVATVWLKQNWSRAPFTIKVYLLTAITVLMLITSMGIFGYLSKAHLDQAVPTGDVAAKVALIDEKIATERQNIETARKALAQMDATVDQTIARSTNEAGASRAAQLRRTQAKERSTLQADITKAQATIAKLNEERAPIAAELRKVEAEVGPIKYIAALIYGEAAADATLLEAAVRWVIIVIVLVFDPLAVILLLASQHSFGWFRKAREEHAEGDSPEKESDVVSTATVTEQPVRTEPTISIAEEKKIEEVVINEETHPYLYKTGGGFKDLKPMVYKPEEPKVEEVEVLENEETWSHRVIDEDEDEHEEMANVTPSEKAAMIQWKKEHPTGSLKVQRKLLERGVIKELPWLKYLKPQEDYVDEAALEAARWAQEQIEKAQAEDSKKKGSGLDGEGRRSSDQENQGDLGYVQNAEQSPKSLWQRVKQAKK